MWERIVPSLKWPAARVDACAILLTGAVAGAGAGTTLAAGTGFTDEEEDASPARTGRAPPPLPPPPATGILREISKLSSFHMRRAARCSYTVLGERDSRESLSREMGKSASAHALSRRSANIARSGRSVPDFGDSRASSGEESGAEAATSGYGSAERLGFSNPHYEGGPGGTGGDVELQDLRAARAPAPAPARRLLLVGGREAPHVALLQSPLSMWTYRLVQ